MSTDTPIELTEEQQVAEVERYMAETKRALKVMSKNDLIRAVSALLLDKRILINQLNRLQSQNEVLNAKTIPGSTVDNIVADSSKS